MILLAQECLNAGGILKPLLISSSDVNGPSLSNPSILVNGGEIFINIRNLNYVLFHSENNKHEHWWGPLCYLHKENEQKLITHNIICKLDSDWNITLNTTVDTSFLDQNPIWEFIGLEDGRLVFWEDKLYLCGVRRDTTPNGVGRMELSEITLKKNKVLEVGRSRIPAPGKDDSYCEKNWMPVLDKPYTFVKWTNPTEVVEFNKKENTTKTIKISDYKNFGSGDLRGGSQVLSIGDFYLAIVHETDLFSSEAGRKNAIYLHRFVVWDKEFNLIEISEKFSFMGANIEFCCGMSSFNEDLLITFGFQDNAAFLLKMPKKLLGKLLKNYE